MLKAATVLSLMTWSIQVAHYGKAAEALKERGAKRVFAYATHAVFSGTAANNIKNSVLDQVIVTDSISLSPEMAATGK